MPSTKHSFTGELYFLKEGQVPPDHQGKAHVFVTLNNGNRWYATLQHIDVNDNKGSSDGLGIYQCYITKTGVATMEATLEPYDDLNHMHRLAIVHFISFKPIINVAGDLHNLVHV